MAPARRIACDLWRSYDMEFSAVDFQKWSEKLLSQPYVKLLAAVGSSPLQDVFTSFSKDSGCCIKESQCVCHYRLLRPLVLGVIPIDNGVTIIHSLLPGCTGLFTEKTTTQNERSIRHLITVAWMCACPFTVLFSRTLP